MQNLTEWVLESSKPKAWKVEFIDYETENVGQLMQQENIKITEGTLVRNHEVQPINGMGQVFNAGKDTDTLVFYSQENEKLMIMSNEFAELVFIYTEPITGIHKIKPIVNDAISSKKWTAHEIV